MSTKNYLFLADGFEDVEALAVVDILRRGAVDVETVSITDSYQVRSAHNVIFNADSLLQDVNLSNAHRLIFPGGMPGAANLAANLTLMDALAKHAKNNGEIAAICAAPAVVLGQAGLLIGKKATCYPGFGEGMTGAIIEDEPVVVDGNIITAKGPGFAFDFGLAILAADKGEKVADEVARGMLLKK